MKYLESYNEMYNQQFDELESLDEGFKEIALAILMLAGGHLNAQNSNIAKKSLNNIEIVQQIDNTLNDADKLKVVIDKVSDKLPQAGKLIQKNADKIKDKIENISNKQENKTKVVKTSDANELINRLRQGYAISNIQVTQDTILPQGTIVGVQDVIELDWSSDNFFKTGTFNLTEASVDSLNGVMSQINESGGKILSMEIVSSTDKEPIKMGNEKLAQLRANSVKSEVNKSYEGEIKITTLPNSGEDLYSKTMSNSERQEARKKTSEHRYVKIKLTVSYELESSKEETIYDIITKYDYELVKIYNKAGSKKKIKHKRKKSNTKCKFIKIKHKGNYKTALCPNW